jgi:hypothetical protein
LHQDDKRNAPISADDAEQGAEGIQRLLDDDAANKPIAKRLEKACKSIPVVRSGWFPKTVISTSITPNAMPQRSRG